MMIRELLAKKKNRYFLTMVGAAFLAILSAQGTYFFLPGWPIAVALLLVALAIAGWIAYRFRVRCPRCNGNIGAKYTYFGKRGFLLFRPVAHCPFCGVSLDEPVGA